MACKQIRNVNARQPFTLFFTVRNKGTLINSDSNKLYLSGAGFADGTVLDIVTNPSVGKYEIDVIAPQGGVLVWVQIATAAGVEQGTSNGYLVVEALPFPIAP